MYFRNMKNEDIQSLLHLLSTPKKIAIIPHRSPDGDAMGSTLGLYHFLLMLNHQPIVISPNEFPNCPSFNYQTNDEGIFTTNAF